MRRAANVRSVVRKAKLAISRLGHELSDPSHTADEQAPPTLAQLGLDHLTEGQRVGLRDDTMGGFFNNETGELFRGFPLSGDDVLVDVGCGGGGPLGFASKFAGHIVAIDITEQAINDAQAYLAGRGADLSKCEFVLGTAENVSLPDSYATRVMCMEVLEHVDDPAVALAELVRIGKPGALYLITVPDERTEVIMKTVAPDAAFQKPHHIRTISAENFEVLVSGAGLEIINHSFNGFYRAMWLAMFWARCKQMSAISHASLPTEFTEDDPILAQWSRSWNELLHTPTGPQIKDLLDSLLPKSQIIVARKPA